MRNFIEWLQKNDYGDDNGLSVALEEIARRMLTGMRREANLARLAAAGRKKAKDAAASA